MTDRTTSDLAALLTPPPSAGVQFSQARVLTWNSELLSNTLEWRGITLRDVPIVEGINALVIQPGDIVGLLGWAPENSKGVGSWWILGKLSNPGEFVADINITAQIFYLRTPEGNPLAFFGRESDGDPLWILYYGGSDGQAAIRTVNGDYVSIKDRSGYEVFGTDGASGYGLSRPYLNYLIHPTTAAEQSGTTYLPATTSNSFTPIWSGENAIFHPRVSYGVIVIATGTTEWRLRANDGTGLVTIASGSGGGEGTVNYPGWGSTTFPGSLRQIVLEARNTGGGTTHIGVDRLYGTQSLWRRLPTSLRSYRDRIRHDSSQLRSMGIKMALRQPAPS